MILLYNLCSILESLHIWDLMWVGSTRLNTQEWDSLNSLNCQGGYSHQDNMVPRRTAKQSYMTRNKVVGNCVLAYCTLTQTRNHWVPNLNWT